MNEPNPFKRDEREEMRAFWLGEAAVIFALFFGCIIAAAVWP